MAKRKINVPGQPRPVKPVSLPQAGAVYFIDGKRRIDLEKTINYASVELIIRVDEIPRITLERVSPKHTTGWEALLDYVQKASRTFSDASEVPTDFLFKGMVWYIEEFNRDIQNELLEDYLGLSQSVATGEQINIKLIARDMDLAHKPWEFAVTGV